MSVNDELEEILRPKSFGDVVVAMAEDNIKELFHPPETSEDLNSVEVSRAREESEVKEKIAKLKRKIKRYGNTKNHRRVAANESLSEKRKFIRYQILELEERLHQIEDERRGGF